MLEHATLAFCRIVDYLSKRADISLHFHVPVPQGACTTVSVQLHVLLLFELRWEDIQDIPIDQIQVLLQSGAVVK